MHEAPPAEAELEVLLNRGNFERLQLELGEALASGTATSSDLVMLIHSYADQGKVRRALESCTHPRLERTDVLLHEHFLRSFVEGEPGRGIGTLESIIPHLSDQPSFLAVALDLLGRLQLLAVEWNLAPDALMLEAQGNLHRAAQIFRALNDPAKEYEAIRSLAQAYLSGRCSNFLIARSLTESLERLAISIDDSIRLGHARLLRWDINLREAAASDLDTSAGLLRSLDAQGVLSLFREGGYVFGEADVLATLGLALMHRDSDESEQLLSKALAHYRAFGYTKGAFHIALQLAAVLHERGKNAEALEASRTAGELAIETGCPLFEIMTSAQRAHILLAKGSAADSLQILTEAFERLDDSAASYAVSGVSLAALGLLLGDYERARSCAQRAVRVLSRVNPSPALSRALLVEGNAAAALRDWDSALRSWRRGARIDRRLGDPLAEQEKLVAMAQGTALSGQPVDSAERHAESLALLTEARRVAGTLSNASGPAAMASIEEVEGQIHIMFRQHLDAIRSFEKARSKYESLGRDVQVAHCNLYLGASYFELARLHQNPEFFSTAALFQEAAVKGFSKLSIPDPLWKALYQRAITSIRHGMLQVLRSHKINLWTDAARWLEESAALIETLPRTDGSIPEQRKVFQLGVELFKDLLHDDKRAAQWMERERFYAGESVAETPDAAAAPRHHASKRRIGRIRREQIPRILH